MNWNFAVKYRDYARGAEPFAWFASFGDASNFVHALDRSEGAIKSRYEIVDEEGNVIA